MRSDNNSKKSGYNKYDRNKSRDDAANNKETYNLKAYSYTYIPPISGL